MNETSNHINYKWFWFFFLHLEKICDYPGCGKVARHTCPRCSTSNDGTPPLHVCSQPHLNELWAEHARKHLAAKQAAALAQKSGGSSPKKLPSTCAVSGCSGAGMFKCPTCVKENAPAPLKVCSQQHLAEIWPTHAKEHAAAHKLRKVIIFTTPSIIMLKSCCCCCWKFSTLYFSNNKHLLVLLQLLLELFLQKKHRHLLGY